MEGVTDVEDHASDVQDEGQEVDRWETGGVGEIVVFELTWS